MYLVLGIPKIRYNLFVGNTELLNRKVYILSIVSIFSMGKQINLKDRKNDEVTSIKVNMWFLKMLERYRHGRESWQEIAVRLITSKTLSNKDRKELNNEVANYEKFL